MPVARAVIGGEAGLDYRSGLNRFVNDPRALCDPTKAHQSDLRRINDSIDSFHALLAQTCYRNRRIA